MVRHLSSPHLGVAQNLQNVGFLKFPKFSPPKSTANPLALFSGFKPPPRAARLTPSGFAPPLGGSNRPPTMSPIPNPLSWYGCRDCVLLPNHLLVLAWWWFAGWIWVSAVFRLAWRVSSARMVFGKLLVLPKAPTA